jgi:putative FmdB family regulatory protein
MPTYDYVCDACNYHFAELQSFKEDPLKTCPSCREDRLRRLFGTGAAILFKGSGFYETDYRSDSYKQAAKAESEAINKASESSKTDPGKTTTSSDKTTPVAKNA